MAISISQLRIEATMDAAAYVAGGNEKAAADAKMVNSGNALAGSLENTDRKLGTSATTLERLTRTIDPAYAATQKLVAGQQTLQRAFDAGRISQDEFERRLELVRQRYGTLTNSINDNVRQTNTATVSTAQMRFAVQNLGFQINDVATSLASGSSPMRVLTQQAGQFVQAFQAGGGPTAVLKAFGSTIVSMVTPTTAAIAGVTALAGGFAVLLSRAQTNAEQLRQFNIILDTTGRNAQGMAASVRSAARDLQQLGLSRDDAISAQSSLIRNVTINPSLTGRLGVLGANVGQALGVGTTAGIDKISAAATSGTDALVKLGLEMGKLSVAEATAHTVMAQRGEGLKAQNSLIQLYEDRLKDLRKNAMTPMEEATTKLSTSWDDFLTKLSNTSPIQGARQAIIDFLTAGSGFLSGKYPSADNSIFPGGIHFGSITEQGLRDLGITGGPGANAPGAPPTQRPIFGSGFGPQGNRLSVGGYQNIPTLANPNGIAPTWKQDYPESVPRTNVPGEFTPGYDSWSLGAGGRMWRSASQIAAGGLRINLGGDTGGAGAAFVGADPQKTAAANSERIKYTDTTKQMVAAESQWGAQQRASAAYFDEYRRVLDSTNDATLAHAAGQVAAARATQLLGVEVQKQTTLQTLATQGERAVAEALKTSEAEALKVAAAYQARSEFLQGRTLNEAARAEEILAAAAAKTAVELQRGANENKNRTEIAKLEVQAQGQLPEVIQQQVDLLQAKQQLLQRGVDLSSAEGQNYLKSVDALTKANVQLAEAQRQQQRMDDLFRQIGDSISSTIGQAIEGIFDKKKVIDWGQSLKSALSSIVGQVAQSLLVRPLTGELLGAIGASPTVLSQFGVAGVGGNSSLFSTGNLLSGGGLLKDLFGGSGGLFGSGASSSSGGLFSGVSDFFSGGLGGIFGRSAPDFGGGGELGIAAGTGEIGTLPGSLFGSTTFGGALGGLGIGGAAGGLLSSLLGGNSMIGGLGGSIGGLAGTLLGGPIGGIFGGLLGGLGGLFGNNKPSNQSAGANFDLSNFKLTAGFAGGNSQIDQATQQVAQGLQSFLALLKTTGGTLSGNVLLQNGVNTGFTADSSLPQYSGRYNLGKDPTSVLNTIELALSRSLTGISDTMRAVLDKTTDPSALQANIAFANAYDALKTAADDAFKSVENGKNDLGPFGIAMQQITTLFQGFTDQANQFGLALDPINAALAEATSRLQGDFGTALDTALNAATGNDVFNQLQSVYDSTIKTIQESQQIGLGTDPATQDKIRKTYEAQLSQILGKLDTTELDQVIQHFTGLNDAIVILAKSAEAASASTADLAQSQADQAAAAQQAAAAEQQIQKFLDSLRANPTITSPAVALANAQSQYQSELGKAQGGDVNALSDITQYADTLIKDIQGYYASSQTGQNLIQQIETDLQALVGVPGTVTVDPVVAAVTTLNTTVSNGTDQTVTTITSGTQALIDANNAFASQTIAQNNADTATLVDITNKTAAANIASNQAATAELVAANNQTATDIVAQNDAAAQAIVASNNETAATAIAQNNQATAALVAANNDTATAIVAQNDASSAALIAANDNGTAAIVAQNDAASTALIAANDNSSAAIIAQADAATAAILAGSSADAQAIGGVIQVVGDEIAQLLNAVVSTSAVSATYDAANSIVQAINLFADNQVSATYGSANSIVQSEAAYLNNVITAVYGAANSIIQTEAVYLSNVATSVYGAANSIVTSEAAYLNNVITAVYGAANSLINVGATYSNAQVSAIYGAANSIVSSSAYYANNNYIAIGTAAASNDNLLVQNNNWLNVLTQNMTYFGTTNINQLQDIENKLQQMIDLLRLQAAA